MGREQKSAFYDKHLKKGKYQQPYILSDQVLLWKLAYVSGFSHVSRPRVYEIGCGTGQFARLLWDVGVKDYTGIDFSKVAIASAKKMCAGIPFSFQHKNLHKVSTKDLAGYNVVAALEVLEHVEKDIPFLEKVPPGVRVVMSVPAFDSPGHVRFFTKLEDVTARYGMYIKLDEQPLFVSKKWWLLWGDKA